jgi:hypothetical protein
MALSDRLDLYLKLERIMLELDDRADSFADQLRDIMDPLWYELSKEEHEFLDGRGEIDVRVLYPVTLIVPDLYRMPCGEASLPVEVLPENGVGIRFALKEAILWAA